MKLLNKILSFISVFLLLFYQLAIPLTVLAQEATPSAIVEEIVEPSPTPSETSIPTTTPNPETTPSATPTFTPTQPPAPVSDWSDLIDKSATTRENVVTERLYTAPQNNKVTVKFNKLPENRGKLTIKEIALTSEQVAETKALSNIAYDISSTMENGTFEYTLTLPTPKTENVEVKASEDGQTFVTLGGVSAQEDTLTITGLNHFTVFVVSSPTAAGDSSGIGSIIWSNTTNVFASDDTYATVNLNNNDISHYLKATSYGFSIPSTATILGITVEVERKCSASTGCVDKSVKLIKGGTVSGDEKADTVTAYPTTDDNTYKSYGGSSDLWGLTLTPADINAIDFGVAFASERTAGGSKTFSVDHIKVTIAYNRAPVASDQSTSTNEDTAKAITLGVTDPDSDTLTYSIVSNPGNGSLSGTPPNLTYTPNANYNGSDSFTFKANDATVDSNTATVSITVNSVNDTPSFTKGADQTISEDAGAQTATSWATSISIGPANESTQTPNFIVTNNNNSLFSVQPAVAANGTLTYTPASNANGSATVTVSIHDDGGTANGGNDTSATQTFTITVNAVNDAPVVTVTSPNGGEVWSGTHNVTWSATDADNDSLTIDVQYSANNGADWTHIAFPSNIGSYGVDTTALTALSGDGNQYLIRVIANDSTTTGQDDSNAVFTIDNTAPSGTIAINGGAAYTNNQTVTLTLSGTDNLSGVTQMEFNNGTGSYSGLESYATTKSWTLSSSGDGLKTVRVKFVDGAGNETSTGIPATITLDTTAPVIGAHDSVTAEATSASGATVTYTAPNATDNIDPTAPAACDPASGSTFALGDTIVTCDATDTADNPAEQTTFTVTVQDTTPPDINLNGDTPDVEINSIYDELGATATDIVDGLFDATPTGFVDTTTVGSYIITYDAMDSAGNNATPITRTVRVVDTTATIFDGISNTLALLGIANNLDEVTSESIGSFFGLSFEKSVQIGEIITKIGGITFNSMLDLSSQLTQDFLQSLGTYMEANPGSMKFDATTEEQLKNAGAEIRMYGLNDLGYTDVPQIIVKDDLGNIIPANDLNYPSLTGQTYSSGDNGTLTFNTSHFTQFDLPDSSDVADVTADKEALVEDSIKGSNPDLLNTTVALATLPLSGEQGSEITWASSNSDIVSNDGQTVNRPANGESYTTIVLTATFTKGLATDTKEFTLNVIELPPPPSAPVLHEVSSPTKDTTPTLSWDAVTADPAVTSYEIEIYDSNEDNIYPDNTITTTEANFTLDDLLGEDYYTWYVRAQNSAGYSDWSESSSFTVDTTNPTVTALGDNTSDYQLPLLREDPILFGSTLIFNEELSSAGKTAVQNALTAGADKALTFRWGSGDISNKLRISTADATTATFANDVLASVSDLAGNTATLKLVDSELDTATQTAPDDSGNATIDNTHKEVVIISSSQSVTVNVGSISDATINYDALITGGTGIIPQTTINSDKANIVIPASTTVTSTDTTWNGVIAAPTVTTITLPETAGETKTLSTAIEIGFSGTKLSFDKAVRILLPNQAGKRVGYVRTGIAFTEITSTCSTDNQATGDALAADGDCKIDVGSDLVIWTKHFTKFATYTQTTNSTTSSSSSSSSNSSGGGSTSAPTCGDAYAGGPPTLLSAVATGANQVTLTWSKALDPVTHYVVTYGLSSGEQRFGNPSVGGKSTTTYTVSGLSGGTTYYFKVRAGNGCNAGGYSNELSATPGGIVINTPAAGFAPGVLGVSTENQGNVGIGEEGQVQGEATVSSEEAAPTSKSAETKNSSPFNARTIFIIAVALLLGFGVFKLLIK